MCRACLALIGLSALAAAAAPSPTAQGAEYSADAFEAAPGNGMRAGRLYVNGSSHRFDYQSRGMPVSEITLPDQGIRRFVFPLTRTYIEQRLPPATKPGTPCPAEPQVSCTKDGDADVGGIATEIWVIKPEQGHGETRVWWDKVRQLVLRARYADGRAIEARRAGEETYDGRAVERWQITYRLPNGQWFPGEALFDTALATTIAERRSDGGRRHLVNISVTPIDKSSFDVPAGFKKLPDPATMRSEAAGAAATNAGGRHLSPIARPGTPMPAPGPALPPTAAPAPMKPAAVPAEPAAPVAAPEAARPAATPKPEKPAEAKPAEAGQASPVAPAPPQPAVAPATVPAEKIIDRAPPVTPLPLLQPAEPAEPAEKRDVVASQVRPTTAPDTAAPLVPSPATRPFEPVASRETAKPSATALPVETTGTIAEAVAVATPSTALESRAVPQTEPAETATPPLPVAKPAAEAAAAVAAAAAAATARAAAVNDAKPARGKAPAGQTQARTKPAATRQKPTDKPVPNPSGIPTLSALPPANGSGATAAAKTSGATASGKQRKRTAKSTGSNRSKKGRRKAR